MDTPSSFTQFYQYIRLCIQYEEQYFTLQNKCPLNNTNFLTFVATMKLIPNRINSNISLIISCSNAMSIPLICCKVILVTKDFKFACSHTIHNTIAITTNDIKAVTKRKKYLLYNC